MRIIPWEVDSQDVKNIVLFVKASVDLLLDLFKCASPSLELDVVIAVEISERFMALGA